MRPFLLNDVRYPQSRSLRVELGAYPTKAEEVEGRRSNAEPTSENGLPMTVNQYNVRRTQAQDYSLEHAETLSSSHASTLLPLPDSEMASTVAALLTWPEDVRARTTQALRGVACMLWARARIMLFFVSLLTAWLSPTIHAPLTRAFRASMCASPLASAFTACGHADVVVMHDFAALAQVHTMMLERLFSVATVEWYLSDELAHGARNAKELAYRVDDSSLPSKKIISEDIRLLDTKTRTAANSLSKLTAGTTGTITRTHYSFNKIINVLYDANKTLTIGGPNADAVAIERKFEGTFLVASQELHEDLDALQNATYFTLTDLTDLEEHINALGVIARREDRDLSRTIAEASRVNWFGGRKASDAELDVLAEDALLLDRIRKGCTEGRAAVMASLEVVKLALSEMEYLSGLSTTRLMLNGTALTELIGDLERYKADNAAAAQKFEDERAQARAAKFDVAALRQRIALEIEEA